MHVQEAPRVPAPPLRWQPWVASDPALPSPHGQRGRTCTLSPARTQENRQGTSNAGRIQGRAHRGSGSPMARAETRGTRGSLLPKHAKGTPGKGARERRSLRGTCEPEVAATFLGLPCGVSSSPTPATCNPIGESSLGLCQRSHPLEKSGREILTQPPPPQTPVPAYGSRCHVREHE